MLLRKYLFFELGKNDSNEKLIFASFVRVRRWPAYKRDSIWRTLRAAGIDYLNADNLKAASEI